MWCLVKIISAWHCSVRRPEDSGHCPTAENISTLYPHLLVDPLHPFLNMYNAIQVLELLMYVTGSNDILIFLTNLGFAYFPIIGGFYFPLAMLVPRTSMIWYLDCLSPIKYCLFIAKVFLYIPEIHVVNVLNYVGISRI